MNAFQIKVLAIVFMVIDHIGLFFFPQVLMLGVIGRFAFPMFGWLIANGAFHTKNINLYLRRLFIFAVITQVPYVLANRFINPSFIDLNVLFTLFLGLLAIKIIKSVRSKNLIFFGVIGCLAAGYFFRVDYGIMGVLSVIIFYVFYKNLKYLIFFQSLNFIFFSAATLVWDIWFNIAFENRLLNYVEPVGLFSLMFISAYDGKEGYKAKYLFYYFYLAQYILILLLKIITG